MTKKGLRFNNLLGALKESLAEIPEHCSGAIMVYELADAGLAAFGYSLCSRHRFWRISGIRSTGRDTVMWYVWNRSSSCQDGHAKQDCERQALKRWVKRNGWRLSAWEVTLLADDLHVYQSICELLRVHRLHFIVTCKEESHVTLCEELELLQGVAGIVSSWRVRKWNGCFHEEWVYH